MARLVITSLLVAITLTGCHDSNSHCYEDIFGNTKPGSLKILACDGGEFRDVGHYYVRFYCNNSDMHRLFNSGFRVISPREFIQDMGSTEGPTPSWWKPVVTKTAVCLHSTSFHKDFQSGATYLTYDHASNIGEMYWEGSD